MTNIMNKRLQGTVWVGLMVLMAIALGLLIQREEEMVMGLTIIAVIIMLGLIMPLFWIVGTVGSITYYCLNRMGAAFEERTVTLSPQLGFTMADGGDPIAEEKKEPTGVTQASVTETSQGSPEQIAQRPVRDKMFWWGGY